MDSYGVRIWCISLVVSKQNLLHSLFWKFHTDCVESLAFSRHTYLGRNIKRASTAAYLKEITMLKEDKIVVQRAVT